VTRWLKTWRGRALQRAPPAKFLTNSCSQVSYGFSSNSFPYILMRRCTGIQPLNGFLQSKTFSVQGLAIGIQPLNGFLQYKNFFRSRPCHMHTATERFLLFPFEALPLTHAGVNAGTVPSVASLVVATLVVSYGSTRDLARQTTRSIPDPYP
jgi:hypothetical protein